MKHDFGFPGACQKFRHHWRCLLMACAGLLMWPLAFAVEPQTAHTFRLTEGEERPAATLDDAQWLVGRWEGTAFGQRFEETWNPPSAGSMLGSFKLMQGDGVRFYELLLLTVENGSLSLKVRHFNPDFSAWEDRDEHVNFRLVKISDDALHFHGISFYRRDDDHLDGYIVMKEGDTLTEHHLAYRRIK